MKTRREILTSGALAALGGAAGSLPATSARSQSQSSDTTTRWGMVIDLRKCIGCQACTVSCSMENRVPHGEHRTVVSTYEIPTDKGPGQAVLPRLCNHCENPPCIPVCPVKATYQQEDGTVLVDANQCVGCGYCVQACPYDARFINKETGVADKCTFCVQRVGAGLLPACVETCVGGARVFGNLKDPNSEVLRLKREHDVNVLRPGMGTRPQVFYIGLDGRLQDRVEAEAGARKLRVSDALQEA
jgi:tetrathionate reductase subunit B